MELRTETSVLEIIVASSLSLCRCVKNRVDSEEKFLRWEKYNSTLQKVWTVQSHEGQAEYLTFDNAGKAADRVFNN